MSKNLKHIGMVSALTMVSRVLGLVRDVTTGGVFGTSALISSFFTGLTLPNLFRRLLAEGGMTAAFVPTLNDQLKERQREGAFELVNQVATWLLAVTTVIVGLAMLAFSQEGWVRWAGVAFDLESDTLGRWLDAARFTVILFPYLVFVSLAAAFSATLQSLHRFLEPALSPIWLNLSIIGALAIAVWGWTGDPATQVLWLCAAWLVGGFLQMAVPAWALMREGWRPRLDFTWSAPLRAMVALMVPTLFSSSIYLVNMSASRAIGLSLNDAAVAVLNFAQRLMELPIGVFAVAVATVVFPLISRYAAANDHDGLAQAYRRGMRLILLINIPAAAGLAVLSGPIVRVLFQFGRFGAESSAIMTPVVVASALGLPFLSFASLALRAFYAQKDTVIPVRAALLSFVVNIIASIALMNWLAEVGLAIASGVASAAQAAYLQWHLSRKLDALSFRFLVAELWRIIGATFVMSLVVGGGWWAWTRVIPMSRATDALGLAVMVGLGVASYGTLAWFLRIGDRDEVSALFARLRRKAG